METMCIHVAYSISADSVITNNSQYMLIHNWKAPAWIGWNTAPLKYYNV